MFSRIAATRDRRSLRQGGNGDGLGLCLVHRSALHLVAGCGNTANERCRGGLAVALVGLAFASEATTKGLSYMRNVAKT